MWHLMYLTALQFVFDLIQPCNLLGLGDTLSIWETIAS